MFTLALSVRKFLTLIITLLLTFSSNAAFDIKARTAILQDYLSGEILYEKDPDKSIYPASMTKIMTAIIAFDLIKSGDLNLDEKFSESGNPDDLEKANGFDAKNIAKIFYEKFNLAK